MPQKDTQDISSKAKKHSADHDDNPAPKRKQIDNKLWNTEEVLSHSDDSFPSALRDPALREIKTKNLQFNEVMKSISQKYYDQEGFQSYIRTQQKKAEEKRIAPEEKTLSEEEHKKEAEKSRISIEYQRIRDIERLPKFKKDLEFYTAAFNITKNPMHPEYSKYIDNLPTIQRKIESLAEAFDRIQEATTQVITKDDMQRDSLATYYAIKQLYEANVKQQQNYSQRLRDKYVDDSTKDSAPVPEGFIEDVAQKLLALQVQQKKQANQKDATSASMQILEDSIEVTRQELQAHLNLKERQILPYNKRDEAIRSNLSQNLPISDKLLSSYIKGGQSK